MGVLGVSRFWLWWTVWLYHIYSYFLSIIPRMGTGHKHRSINTRSTLVTTVKQIFKVFVYSDQYESSASFTFSQHWFLCTCDFYVYLFITLAILLGMSLYYIVVSFDKSQHQTEHNILEWHTYIYIYIYIYLHRQIKTFKWTNSKERCVRHLY
jgi:hypothetical protein